MNQDRNYTSVSVCIQTLQSSLTITTKSDIYLHVSTTHPTTFKVLPNMPTSIYEFMHSLLLVIVQILLYPFIQAICNGETYPQSMRKLKIAFYVIATYLAVFFPVYYLITSVVEPAKQDSRIGARTAVV